MRRDEFRVYDVDKDEMFRARNFDFKNKKVVFHYESMINQQNDTVILMKGLELRDSFRKQIFEGDFLELKVFGKNAGIFIVEYSSVSNDFLANKLGTNDSISLNMAKTFAEEIKVVGNILQDKEILLNYM